jgi:N4-gp56 family major capsid protein
MMHTLKQYGSYVNTTDVQLAAAADPVLKIISERQATQAGETIDFLSYKVFRAGTQVKYVGTSASARTDVDMTIGGVAPTVNDPTAGTQTLASLQTAIRALENNDAGKLKSKLKASVGISTEPIRESYIAICHPDLRQDIQQLPGFVAVEKYSDQSDAIEGEIGGVEGVRFITTTQAVPFKDAGDTNGAGAGAVSTGGSNNDVYPVLIFAEDAIGCATLGGMDSLRSKVVMPKPGPGDPLGQRGTVAWDTFYSCIILQDLWMYRLEVACTRLS